ncbi:hypothetical protein GFS03_08410 [Sulfolobus sp. E5-1-F]|uniref:hypothetical protein n=1 Tax=Sulfolobaceae TaxID=118883 RepID=UPI00129488A8|nr:MULTISPECIES: hypothetical protein [unclassified Sulfolobus]QGA54587.1 hypothetical protein GFS03_08410 [Sulfolobus sp. E5-1-F]QGA67446.1 hypothetical protein GFS33_00180 [Sulfolobus sp. E11-6]
MGSELQKFYAIAKVYGFEIETKLHDHISAAVDEAIDKIKLTLRKEGMNGKTVNAVIEVFAKDERASNLIESIKARITT